MFWLWNWYSVNFTDCISLFTDYGDKHNEDFAEQFGAFKEDFPVYKLFKQEDGPHKTIPFTGNTNDPDEISYFLMRETG